VLDLLEDEAIMALPLAPSHAVCARPGETAQRPGGAGVGVDPDDPEEGGRPNPFAVLAALKKPPVNGGGEN